MKAQPYRQDPQTLSLLPCEPQEATHVEISTPGPIPTRLLPVGGSGWTWNGDLERPTFRPSILSRTADASGEIRCHSYVTDGRIEFLGDCSHELAGQTVDLLNVDE